MGSGGGGRRARSMGRGGGRSSTMAMRWDAPGPGRPRTHRLTGGKAVNRTGRQAGKRGLAATA